MANLLRLPFKSKKNPEPFQAPDFFILYIDKIYDIMNAKFIIMSLLYAGSTTPQRLTPKKNKNMNIFSFHQPVEFKGDNVVTYNLALNHNYEQQGSYLVARGTSPDGKEYVSYYDLNGKFLEVVITIREHSVALLSWRVEKDYVTVIKINRQGNRLTEVSAYMTTDLVKNKLTQRTFTSTINGETVQRSFKLGNKGWNSYGKFPREHFLYWIRC